MEKGKEEEEHEIIDEAQLALEYQNKNKEKLMPNKNDFNKITYVKYNLLKKEKPEIDFLYDYSKILGPKNNDPKIIQWQLLNLDRLFKYGIDISVLKKRNKEQSSGHFKMSNVLENISYRLQKHGRLAPSCDIARILPKRSEEELQINEEEEDDENDINIENEEINNGDSQSSNFKKDNNNNQNITFLQTNICNNDNINITTNNELNLKIEDNNPINDESNININLNKKNNNPNGYNGYEDNFYDKNDPFIDDELDNTSEENEYLYKLSLEPGNYSEQEILNNLKKNMRKTSRSTVKKKKKINNIKSKKEKEKTNKSLNKKVKKLKVSNKLLTSKTKRKNNEEIKDINKKKKKINIDSLSELSETKIEEFLTNLMSDYDSEIKSDHEKESFIRRNIKIIEEIYKKNQNELINVLSSKLNINSEKSKILIEYEIFKSVLENKYSNFSKFLNKLYTLLNNNGIQEINSLDELRKYMTSVPEIEKSLNHVMDNILFYRDKFNSYMGKHFLDMYKINKCLECFIPNIRERNNEYITKISSKFNEYEEKFKIIIPKDLIVSYIIEKNNTMDFSEDLNSDINNRRFSLKSFIFYDIGSKIIVYDQKKDEENENDVCAVPIENKEIQNTVNNIIINDNKSNNKNNNNKNNNKIFQSYKTDENKTGIKIISMSKIQYSDNKNLSQGIQTEIPK